jgi:DNA repair exonuclease SbcCD nuclease subunit
MEEHNIKRILHLGDYYEHRKFVNFKALHTNRRVFLERLRNENIHMDIIPGNHDVYYKNTNDLCSLKELMGHYTDCVTIHMNPTVVDYDGTDIALIPWINPENELEITEWLDACKANIVGSHLELAGYEVTKGMMCPTGTDDKIFNKFEMVLTGHFHTKSSKGNIHYLGAQMEFFWNDAHDPKYFHVLDTQTRELEAIQNPITLFEKVYYDDTKDGSDYETMNLDHLHDKYVKVIVINKKDTYMFDRLLDRIQNRRILELKIQENFAEFIGTAVDDEAVSVEDTETLLSSYVDAVETELDKERIKTEVGNLMIEAQSLTVA